ncbi:DegT/DnrJ/EryC1/StrS aminotransferase family protein [Desulfosarcina variabilis str. Montpellier]|uniref:DegT/DnrJ/EryC1/StrS family aminotransferase n=1 Tax=Desulfosarcina variabilis TaxID=2300 RepID=UPI003AFAA8AF
MNLSVAGLMSQDQAEAMTAAIEKAKKDPNYLFSLSGEGPVAEFEQAFAEAVGSKYALALSSCTASLHVALLACGIGPGDEVIVSPYTWGQSVAPVLFVGAIPVFADIDPDTCTLDPKSIVERISDKTKAILPVHIFGIPADMDRIVAFAKKNELAVISDAAQAFGALSKGRKLGGLGDVACYSLGRGKIVCGGEGGVLVTNNRQIYEKAILISQHPMRVFREIFDEMENRINELNWNYRIHPLAAVLALADLGRTYEKIRHRREIIKTVASGLDGINSIKVLSRYHGDEPSVYGIPLSYSVCTNNNISRENFVDECNKYNIPIQVGPINIPIHYRKEFLNQEVLYNNCPISVLRCKFQELFLIDAVTIDIISKIQIENRICRLKSLPNIT